MPAATYDKIATTTLGSAQSSVTFSSISGSYTDLVLATSFAIDTSTSPQPPGDYPLKITLNSDTGANYSLTSLYGNGTSALSLRQTNQNGYLWNGGYTVVNNEWQNCIMSFMNYSNTTTYKTILTRINSAGTQTAASVNLWRSTSAISQMYIRTFFDLNFLSGSKFTLYGIKAA